MRLAATLKTFLLGVALSSGAGQAAPLETLTVAGGCFWCVESDFEKVRGVKEVVSGFSGGATPNPTYKQVVGGGTGHKEAVQIRFDPDLVTRDQILAMFLRSVDPVDPGGQFCDRGSSYATAIFPANAAQTKAAKAAISEASAELGQKVVTPVLPFKGFYPAEAYHQDYYKSSERVLTRFGWVTKANAYKRYRKACGRDQRVLELWGAEAPFAKGH